MTGYSAPIAEQVEDRLELDELLLVTFGLGSVKDGLVSGPQHGLDGCCFVCTVPRTASVLVGLGLCMSAQSSGPGLQQNSLPFGLAAW